MQGSWQPLLPNCLSSRSAARQALTHCPPPARPCSALAERQTHIATGSLGTVTHAAPELLQDGRLGKAADIYSLGVCMWEVLSGTAAFKDVPTLKARGRECLQPPRAPQAAECMRHASQCCCASMAARRLLAVPPCRR